MLIIQRSWVLIMTFNNLDRNFLSFESLFLDVRVCSVTHLCLILCISMDCSLPGSSVHGTFPARMGCYFLPQRIFPTQGVTCISCIASGFFITELLPRYPLSLDKSPWNEMVWITLYFLYGVPLSHCLSQSLSVFFLVQDLMDRKLGSLDNLFLQNTVCNRLDVIEILRNIPGWRVLETFPFDWFLFSIIILTCCLSWQYQKSGIWKVLKGYCSILAHKICASFPVLSQFWVGTFHDFSGMVATIWPI